MPTPWPKIRRSLSNPRWPVEHRAITLGQLRSLQTLLERLCKSGLLVDDLDGTRIAWPETNMDHINRLVIQRKIPKDQARSWVELVALGPQPPKYFVSHSWGEAFREFMVAIEHFARDRCVRVRDTYWICTFAIDQWDVDLGGQLRDSPFVQALSEAESCVLQLDTRASSLTRVWCLLEVFMILNEPGKDLFVVTPNGLVGSQNVRSGPAIEALRLVDSRTCQASKDVDRRQILNFIANVPEDTGMKKTQSGDLCMPKELDPAFPKDQYEAELIRNHGNAFEVFNDEIRRWATDAGSSILPLSLCRLSRVADIRERGLSLTAIRNLAAHSKALCAAGKMFTYKTTTETVSWESLEIYDLGWTYLHLNLQDECSYMEAVEERGQQPEYSVCMAYSTKLHEVMAAIEWHAEARGLPDNTVYWSWFFSLSRQEVSDYLGRNVSPTECVTEVIEGMVMVLTANGVDNNGVAVVETLRRTNPVQEMFHFFMDSEFEAKTCDLVCATGALAGTNPFAWSRYEFGLFDPRIAEAILSFDVQKVSSQQQTTKDAFLQTLVGTPVDCDRLHSFNRQLQALAVGSLLRRAAYCNDLDGPLGLKQVVGKSLVSLTSRRLGGLLGETPLSAAAAKGHLEQIEFLIDSSADPNMGDDKGEAPLHYAALAGQEAAARLLVQRGARATNESHFSERPLDVALHNPAEFVGVDTTVVAAYLASL